MAIYSFLSQMTGSRFPIEINFSAFWGDWNPSVVSLVENLWIFTVKKVEIFYTLGILVMKLKQLQKGQNLIGYWSLDACLSCSSFSCCQSYITSVFTMWSAKQIPIDSQTKVSFKMTKNRRILQFLYWAPHPSLK